MTAYLLLVCAVFFNGLQNVISKQYNVKAKFRNAYVYTAAVTLTATMFFVAAAVGTFEFNVDFLGYSVAFGAAYVAATIGNIKAIEHGPLSLSVLINQFSLTVPMLYGLLVLDERLDVCGYLGIAFMFICLILVNPQKANNGGRLSYKWFLYVILGFLGNGACSTVQKMQQLKFDGAYKNEFMIFALLFGFAAMLVFIVLSNVKNKKETVTYAIKYAVPQGVANGALNMLIMVLGAVLPMTVLFPAVLLGGILLSFLASVTIFGERLTWIQYFGYAFGTAAVLLINL